MTKGNAFNFIIICLEFIYLTILDVNSKSYVPLGVIKRICKCNEYDGSLNTPNSGSTTAREAVSLL